MKEKEVIFNLTSKFFSQLKHWAFVLFFKKAFRRLSNFTKNELLHIVCTKYIFSTPFETSVAKKNCILTFT